MDSIIDGNIISNETQGSILNFSSKIDSSRLVNNHQYIDARNYKLKGNTPENQAARETRIEIAAPKVIAQLAPLPTQHEITFPALIVKNSGDNFAGLPDILNYALGALNEVCIDIIEQCGFEKFLETEIKFTAGCKQVEPGQYLRPEFSQSHHHLNAIDPVDLIYVTSNILSTEFEKKAGEFYAPPENHLTRFGAETLHRSPLNTTDRTITRHWGVFTVTHEKTRIQNGQPENCVLSKHLSEEARRQFSNAGQIILKSQQKNGHTPTTRLHFTHINPEETFQLFEANPLITHSQNPTKQQQTLAL